MNRSTVPLLPPKADLETVSILKQLARANRQLAELKGCAPTIPNENILINTLALQEAKDSSAIENIITTHDELYKTMLFDSLFLNPSAKEVSRYVNALKEGFQLVKREGIITSKTILVIQGILEQNDAGYRKLPGTVLANDLTGEIIYTPPQDYNTIVLLMDNLIEFINIEKGKETDALIKMAVMHYQFETIHPFYDGNGRTGRILNILYLVQQRLLELPILYLSGFIIKRKPDYYRLLQEVRDNQNWEEWILYILKGVEETARETIEIVGNIREIMQEYKQGIRTNLKKIYSQDLLNNLFKHPYTKVEFMMSDLGITRITASRYLNQLVKSGYLSKHKIGKTNYYVNDRLYRIFMGNESKSESDQSINTITSRYDQK